MAWVAAAPRPLRPCGTKAPTIGPAVAVAMPRAPVCRSRATMEKVITHSWYKSIYHHKLTVPQIYDDKLSVPFSHGPHREARVRESKEVSYDPQMESHRAAAAGRYGAGPGLAGHGTDAAQYSGCRPDRRAGIAGPACLHRRQRFPHRGQHL